MSSSEYKYALMLQLGFIPAGYFPIGTLESLQRHVSNHLKSGASQTEARFYELNGTPSFTKPQITEAAIAYKARRVVAGEDTVTLSSEDLRAHAAPVVGKLGGLMSSAKAALQEVKGGKFDPLRLTSVFGQGQNAVADLTKTLGIVSSKIEQAFWDIHTDDYIRNQHGVFVSKSWLENPRNAGFQSTMLFKPAAPGVQPSVA